jgi:hypothetical protein
MNIDRRHEYPMMLSGAFALARTELERCIDAGNRCRQPLLFCSLSALKLLGIPIPLGHRLADDKVHVCVSRQDMRSTVKGVNFRVWSLPLQKHHLQDGISVVDPITACMQMLAFCSREEAAMLFDSLMCRDPQRHMVSLGEIEGYLAGVASFRGKKNAVWALDHCREGMDSPMETRLRLRIEQSGLLRPEVNHRLVHPETHEVWYLDLAYPQRKIAIEYQGEEFHATRAGLQRDSRKIAALQGLGWAVIPITAESLSSERQWLIWMRTVKDIVAQKGGLRSLV